VGPKLILNKNIEQYSAKTHFLDENSDHSHKRLIYICKINMCYKNVKCEADSSDDLDTHCMCVPRMHKKHKNVGEITYTPMHGI
jgi:hypothetical protein